jgi:hypothetical protein
MSREDRNIYFDLEESYKAILGLCIKNGLKNPPIGRITSAAVKAGHDDVFQLRIEDTLQGTGKDVEYTRDFLAAAFINYCRSVQIPLPRKSLKSVSVDVSGEEFVLRVVVHSGRGRGGATHTS